MENYIKYGQGIVRKYPFYTFLITGIVLGNIHQYRAYNYYDKKFYKNYVERKKEIIEETKKHH